MTLKELNIKTKKFDSKKTIDLANEITKREKVNKLEYLKEIINGTNEDTCTDTIDAINNIKKLFSNT